jgi:hypothetical protein
MRSLKEIEDAYNILELMQSSDRFASGMKTALAWVLEMKEDLKK